MITTFERIVRQGSSMTLPSKVLVGKKEWRELNREFYPSERFVLPATERSKSKVSKVVLDDRACTRCELEVVRTKHKSYLRVL